MCLDTDTRINKFISVRCGAHVGYFIYRLCYFCCPYTVRCSGIGSIAPMGAEISCCVAYAMGFGGYTAVSAPATGEPNRLDSLCGRSLSLHFVIPGTSLHCHIHHWVYLLCIATVAHSPLVQWFCFGGASQGVITYRDWYRILYTLPPPEDEALEMI